jgi:general secretion pathway protein A
MDYFNILNMQREPFSNSPDPDLFYLSGQHERCLQRMELAIRLCRGLSVVIGEVGTGKTTLCRELIRRLSPAPDDGRRDDSADNSTISTHLILDPSFRSPLEFLLAASRLFGLAEEKRSEWQLKEQIKNFLFRRGVEAGGVVVLVIDEGQKLPLYCMEILREFLNYETNERKLLQIVIFAQEEFRQTLKKRANFTDRINEIFSLGPLSFLETRKLIRFRLARAGRDGALPPLFTLSGYWAVHRATGGYPRKIITLCHQVVLSLIIRNAIRADWFLVRACVRRAAEGQKNAKQFRWLTGVMTAVLCIAAITLVLQHNAQSVHPVPDMAVQQPLQKTRVSVPPPEAAPVAVAAMTSLPEKSLDVAALLEGAGAPRLLGSLEVREGETFFRIVRNVYGVVGAPQYSSIRAANPHIADIDRIKAKEIVNLPVLAVTSQLPAMRHYWVRIAEFKDIDEAYALLKSFPKEYPPVRLLPYWRRPEGLTFALVLHNGFEGMASDRASAIDMATKLPPVLAARARIISAQPETLFLKRIIE